MKRLIITSVAVLGMFLVGPQATEAGGIHLRFGSSYRGHHGGHGLHGHHGHGVYGRLPSYHYPSYPRWHDTTHYDWHPGGFYRHRNHYHYVPGHYDLHRDGHWHY